MSVLAAAMSTDPQARRRRTSSHHFAHGPSTPYRADTRADAQTNRKPRSQATITSHYPPRRLHVDLKRPWPALDQVGKI